MCKQAPRTLNFASINTRYRKTYIIKGTHSPHPNHKSTMKQTMSRNYFGLKITKGNQFYKPRGKQVSSLYEYSLFAFQNTAPFHHPPQAQLQKHIMYEIQADTFLMFDF